MGWDSDGETRRKCPICHKGPMTRMGGNWSGEPGADVYRFYCKNLNCRMMWRTESYSSRLCYDKLLLCGRWNSAK
jgi:hypothetical protein